MSSPAQRCVHPWSPYKSFTDKLPPFRELIPWNLSLSLSSLLYLFLCLWKYEIMKCRKFFWEFGFKGKEIRLDNRTTAGEEMELEAKWKATEKRKEWIHTTQRTNNKLINARGPDGFTMEGIIGSGAQHELLFLNGDCESFGLSILASRDHN